MILNKPLILWKNARLHTGIFFTIVLAVACATPQTNQLKLKKPHDLPEQILIPDVPFFPQQQYHCGPSTLAMAMSFYGIKTSPIEIARDVFTPELKGSLQVEMKAAVRKRGLLAYELTPELVYLLAEVSVGHPVIVLQNLSIKWYPVWHYALVIGYDLQRNIMILHTGENSNYEISMGTFEQTWRRANNWALVALPSDTLPNDRNLKNILQAAVDLEKVGQTMPANQAYQSITKRWPDNFVAVMGLANTYLKLQQPENATASYLRAIKIQPQDANIYNNLAYSLQAQTCYSLSIQSIQCAIALKPTIIEYQNSLQELLQSKSKTNLKSCPKITCPKKI